MRRPAWACTALFCHFFINVSFKNVDNSVPMNAEVILHGKFSAQNIRPNGSASFPTVTKKIIPKGGNGPMRFRYLFLN